MDKIWVYVYKDTIKSHNEDNNLSRILVTTEFAKQYYNDCMKYSGYDSFDDFMDYYIAEDTMDFYEYAKRHGAIIKIEEL